MPPAKGKTTNDGSSTPLPNAAEDKDNTIKILTFKRGQIRDQLTRFSTFLTDVSKGEKPASGIKSRLDQLPRIFTSFDDCQTELELITLEDSILEVHVKERRDFEDTYYDAITNAQKLIDMNTAISNQSSSSVSDNSSNSLGDNKKLIIPPVPEVKLPAINLPDFDGSYNKWSEFNEIFKGVIENNTSLTTIQKFFYLKSCLKNQASQTIQSLPVSEANYDVAWQLLRSRYENKRVIINSHIKSILEFTPLTKENFSGLRKLLDCIEKNVRALNNLCEESKYWDTLLLFLISRKLDSTTLKDWEMSIKENEIPTYDKFIEFLSNKCHVLETMNFNERPVSHAQTQYLHSSSSRPANKTSFRFGHNNTSGNQLTCLSVNSVRTCPFCKRNGHLGYQCYVFKGLSTDQRFQEVNKLGLCVNCLRSGHHVESCRFSNCQRCSERHNTLLHRSEGRSATSSTIDPNKNSNENNGANTTLSLSQASGKRTECLVANSNPSNALSSESSFSENILLSTAIVRFIDAKGNEVLARGLLDSGSQGSFMTRDLCDRLGLKINKAKCPVSGINGISINLSERVNTSIYSCYNSYKADLSFLILNEITGNIPNMSINPSNIIIPEGIELADKEFFASQKIDVLLGAEIFFELISTGQIKLGNGQPIFQNSKLGWIVSGPLICGDNKQLLCHLSVNKSDEDIRDQMEKFWLVEEKYDGLKLTAQDIECEKFYTDTTKRDSSGRLIVKLPMKADPKLIGNSLTNAIKRFYNIERRLNKNPDLKIQYDDFMTEYEKLGHMTRITDDNINSDVQFYLPHHPVIKEASMTTKVRVVFDGSAKSSSGISLNDILKIGPVLQDDLFSILIRFRKYKFVITADIAKMYRQVLIDDSQRDLQRIVYRWHSDSEIIHFRLNTVTYGTAPASFLAIRSLRQTALDNHSRYPEASKVILQDFYVDDLLTGVNSIAEGFSLINQLNQILPSYGFQLRKWFSNNLDLLKGQSVSGIPFYHITDDKCVKTLGLLWDAELDVLLYSCNLTSTNEKVTKRHILSAISQIFDPLGLIGPVICIAKLIMQKLWQLKSGWDETVPAELQSEWLEFQNKLRNIQNMQIPRHIMPDGQNKIQLHGFSDSSERAYGACIYVRCTNSLGEIRVYLLCAKSRVAPLKVVTLPRLELCAALLLAQLMAKVRANFQEDISDVYYWCDSTIVLSWISSEPKEWKTFVSNRVSEIRRLTQASQWAHVRSSDNPADVISRGKTPGELSECQLWWSGPEWLSASRSSWPSSNEVSNNCDYQAADIERKVVLISINNSDDNFIFARYSTLFRLQKITALCLRFIHNLKNANKKLTGPISVSEINSASIILIKLVQGVHFKDEINSLLSSRPINHHSKILSLNPFLDDKNVLRVGGRIQKSNLRFESKHPILLPRSHEFTRLIIIDAHCKLMHAGTQATLSKIREKYWPVGCRQATKKVIRNCVTCFRAKPVSSIPIMGNLPDCRLNLVRPFFNVGVDFAGPYNIKDGKLRNRKLVKCYVAIFICMATRAVHMEIVSDLSSEGFLNAFKRFTSRRGICKRIYSDNATNFKGANNELRNSHQFIMETSQDCQVKNYFLNNNITWHFIPARSPHFGGLWEAAVKSFKHHFRRVAKNVIFTFEEMSTLTTQIEAILNSRPLLPLSDDPNDFSILTPGHFLIGDSLTCVPEEDVTSVKINLLGNYRKIRQLFQHFWKRWSKEFLTSMQQRNKWKQRDPSSQYPIGGLVILKENNAPPMHWPLGRICAAIPGDDGVIRVLEIQTKNGVLRRAVHQVCLLPTPFELEDASSNGGGMLRIPMSDNPGNVAPPT